MNLHANAKLGLAGCLALVCAIEEGLSLKAAAPDPGPWRTRSAGGRRRPTALAHPSLRGWAGRARRVRIVVGYHCVPPPPWVGTECAFRLSA
jgi:hypothetical protein